MQNVLEVPGARETYEVNTAPYRPETPGVRVQAFCYSLLTPEWRHRGQARPYIMASLILSGENRFRRADGPVVRRGPGFFQLADLNDPSDLRYCLTGRLERYFVLFEITPLLRAALGGLFPAGLPGFHAPAPERLGRAFEALRDSLRNERNDEALHGGLAMRLLFEAARQLPRARVPDALTMAERYIDNHFREPSLTRGGAAAAASVSEPTLARLFRRHRRTTVLAYIVRQRMEEASRLLKFSDCAVAEIAERCGFASAGYFGRKFRLLFGTTPTAFRRRYGRPF